MPAEPTTRYAVTDGVHIAFQVLGHGPAMVVTPGFASHLDREWEDAACRSFLRRLSTFATVIRYDKRGTGLSDPVREPPTLAEREADLAAVLSAVAVERPVLFGFSDGGPIAIRFATHHPGAVAGLVLYGTSAHPPPPWALDQLRGAAAAWGSGASIEHFARSRAQDPAARTAQARFERGSASPAMVQALVESLAHIDVVELLPGVVVPTLVLHRREDMVPIAEAHFLADHIPAARLRELPGIDHRPWEGDAQSIVDEVEVFLGTLDLRSAPTPATSGRRRATRPRTGWASLTERELDVVRLVADGCSNGEVARRLYVSRETVQTHLKQVFNKLGLDSRAAVAAMATGAGHLAPADADTRTG